MNKPEEPELNNEIPIRNWDKTLKDTWSSFTEDLKHTPKIEWVLIKKPNGGHWLRKTIDGIKAPDTAKDVCHEAQRKLNNYDDMVNTLKNALDLIQEEYGIDDDENDRKTVSNTVQVQINNALKSAGEEV